MRSIITLLSLVTLVFAEEFKFNALGFYEFSYTTDSKAIVSNNFEYNRIYLGLEKKMTESLSYRFVADVGRNTDDGRLELYVKNAKVDWKMNIGNLVIGLQGMNLFAVQEKTWGYRSIEKSTMDKNKFASSAAMGLGYYNEFDNLKFSVLVTNGAGYKNPENDSFKKISANINYGPKKLNSEDGMNFGGAFTFEPYDNQSDSEYIYATSIYSGYAKSNIRFGVEWDQLHDTNKDGLTQIISLYGNIAISDKIHLYGRFDHLLNSGITNDYLIFGLAYEPENGLKIMPNIRYINETGVSDVFNYNLNFEFNIK